MVDEKSAALRLVVVILPLARVSVRADPLGVVVAERDAERDAVFVKDGEKGIDGLFEDAMRVDFVVLPADVVAREDEKGRPELLEGGF